MSTTIQSMTEELSIAGQVTEAQVGRLRDSGILAVLNVRSPQENGALSNEQEQIEALGLPYINFPLNPSSLELEALHQAVEQVKALPKPLLIHCRSAMRAAFVVMLYRITHQGLSPEAALAETAALGFDYSQKPPFKAAMEQYLVTYDDYV